MGGIFDQNQIIKTKQYIVIQKNIRETYSISNAYENIGKQANKRSMTFPNIKKTDIHMYMQNNENK